MRNLAGVEIRWQTKTRTSELETSRHNDGAPRFLRFWLHISVSATRWTPTGVQFILWHAHNRDVFYKQPNLGPATDLKHWRILALTTKILLDKVCVQETRRSADNHAVCLSTRPRMTEVNCALATSNDAARAPCTKTKISNRKKFSSDSVPTFFLR